MYRGIENAEEYCLLEIEQDWMLQISTCSALHKVSWSKKDWMKPPDAPSENLKQVSKEEADKILGLEGREKTFICRKIIDWDATTMRIIEERPSEAAKFKYWYITKQFYKAGRTIQREIFLFWGKRKATNFLKFKIDMSAKSATWKKFPIKWANTSRSPCLSRSIMCSTLNQTGIGEIEISESQAMEIIDLHGKTRKSCCAKFITWPTGFRETTKKGYEFYLRRRTKKEEKYTMLSI